MCLLFSSVDQSTPELHADRNFPASTRRVVLYLSWRPLRQASIALIVGGFMYCSRKVESTNVKCDHRGCKVLQLKEGGIDILTIPVRLRNAAAAALAAAAAAGSAYFMSKHA